MQTVGEILRAEREKRGMTVKDVEKGTSIRAFYIQSIEDGNYSVMPGEVYLKGFIRSYANFLNLDSQQLIAMYRKSQEPAPPPPPEADTPEGAPVSSPAASPKVAAPPNTQLPIPERKIGAVGGLDRKWLVIGLLVAAVGVGTWAIASYTDRPEPSPANPAPQAPAKPSPAP